MKQYGAKRKDSAVCTCCGSAAGKVRACTKRGRRWQERERQPTGGSEGDPYHAPTDDELADILRWATP